MMLPILLDHFLGHLTYRCTKKAPRPKMLTPVALLQVRKLFSISLIQSPMVSAKADRLKPVVLTL